MRTLSCALTLLCTLAAGTAHAQAQIPYQGRLDKDGVPMNGKFDFRFELYKSRTTGSCAGTPTPECLWTDDYANVEVKGGRFSVALGSAKAIANSVWLNNEEIYLAIQVAAAGDQYTPLAGRQRILAVPLAARANAAKNYSVTGDLDVAGNATVSGTLTTGIIAPKAVKWADPAGVAGIANDNDLYKALMLVGSGQYPHRKVMVFDDLLVNGALRWYTGESIAPDVKRLINGTDTNNATVVKGNLKVRFGRLTVGGNGYKDITNLGFADHNYVFFGQVNGSGCSCCGAYSGTSGWGVGGAEKIDQNTLRVWNQAECDADINWFAIGL